MQAWRYPLEVPPGIRYAFSLFHVKSEERRARRSSLIVLYSLIGASNPQSPSARRRSSSSSNGPPVLASCMPNHGIVVGLDRTQSVAVMWLTRHIRPMPSPSRIRRDCTQRWCQRQAAGLREGGVKSQMYLGDGTCQGTRSHVRQAVCPMKDRFSLSG